MSLPKQSKSQPSFGFDNNDSKHLPVKLVIYDFDQTITCEHLYYELDGGQEDELKRMSDDKLLKVFGGSKRIQRLTQHFERISLNCELAIISFGWVQVITNALQRMELLKYFSNSVIIGKDSEELKTAGSKAKCIYRMKKKRNLKSDQVVFVDDDNGNIQKAMSYSQTVLITPRSGMTPPQMKEIEVKCGVYPTHCTALDEQISLELTTPKTMKEQITKQYPSQGRTNSKEVKQKSNSLDKYKITSVPKWFDNLSNPETDTPVIQIGGDQTPNSESGEYELNVPMVINELTDVATKKPKNGLSLNLDNDNTPNNQ
eukprot:225038_1